MKEYYREIDPHLHLRSEELNPEGAGWEGSLLRLPRGRGGGCGTERSPGPRGLMLMVPGDFVMPTHVLSPVVSSWEGQVGSLLPCPVLLSGSRLASVPWRTKPQRLFHRHGYIPPWVCRDIIICYYYCGIKGRTQHLRQTTSPVLANYSYKFLLLF
jgi:hypothetical protein